MRYGFDYSDTFMAMGTANTIATDLANREAVRAVRDEMLRLHDRLNAFDDTSDIGRMNINAGREMVPVSSDTVKLLRDSLKLEKETEGAFNISTLPASRMWRKAGTEGRMPTSGEIREAQKTIRKDSVILDEPGHKAGLKRRGQGIDLGGIAKGYASDCAMRIFSGYGIDKVLINFGGTVVTRGVKVRVGIRDPFEPGREIGYVSVKDCAVVTSGVYERGVTIDKKRYHHIIDPRTCKPSTSELVSVTVIGDGAKVIDALATAVLVLGMEEGYRIVRRFGYEAVFVDKKGTVMATEGLKDDLVMR